MSLIQIVISIVLAGLLLSVGVFYGGSTYTNAKPQVNAAEIIGELNQISDAIKISKMKGYSYMPPDGYIIGCDSSVDQKNVSLVAECDKKASDIAYSVMINNGLLSEQPSFGNKEYVFNDSTSPDVMDGDAVENGFYYGDIVSLDISSGETCMEINRMSGGTKESMSNVMFQVNVSRDGGGIFDFASSYRNDIAELGVMGKSVYCAKLNAELVKGEVYRVYKISNMQYFSRLGPR